VRQPEQSATVQAVSCFVVDVIDTVSEKHDNSNINPTLSKKFSKVINLQKVRR
jgi:ribonucleotide reductase alpha subunit